MSKCKIAVYTNTQVSKEGRTNRAVSKLACDIEHGALLLIE